MKITTFKAFAEEQLEEVKWLVKPLIPAAGIILVHGSTDAGKSALLFTLTDAIQQGHPFLGMQTSQANVLYINLDMPESGLQERVRGIVVKPEGMLIPNAQPINVLHPQFRDSSDWHILRNAVTEYKIGLVIFDTLGDLVIGKLSDDEVALGTYRTLREWFPNLAIIVVHHDRKMWRNQEGEGTPGDEDALGSQYWRSKAQSALHLYKQGDVIRELAHTKSHSGEKLPYTIKLQLGDSAMRMELWTGKDHRQAVNKWSEGVDKAKALANGEWQDMNEEERVAKVAEIMSVNTRTVWRWKKALVEVA